MLQFGDYLGFVLEAGAEFWIRGHRRGHYLDGYLPLDVGIRRKVDVRHPAAAQFFEDFVAPNIERHGIPHTGCRLSALLPPIE
jgi:hypothetical protein